MAKRLTEGLLGNEDRAKEPTGVRKHRRLATEGCCAITFPGAEGKGGEDGVIGP